MNIWVISYYTAAMLMVGVYSLKLSVSKLIATSINELQSNFLQQDLKTKQSLQKILSLYREHNIDSSCFHGVNGYGHGDIGREKFDDIIANVMGAQKALVRIQFFSGTHAISKALFTCLRPGDTLLGVSGKPYDTLEEVIGLRPASNSGTYAGSLRDWSIKYKEVDLKIHNKDGKSSGMLDLEAIKNAIINDKTIKVLHIQRSCGYQWRPSIVIDEIERLCKFINTEFKYKGRDLIIFCDNCYSELVEDREPCHVGVDIIAGSLIKNLGGTLASCGGYVAGRKDLVESVANHLSAPGVDGGATLNQYRWLYQGLFMAPMVVGESLKGAALLSHVMGQQLGFECNPHYDSPRTDIVQAIKLKDKSKLLAYCEAVHRNSPVGSYIKPVPGITAGYGDEVIFADGTFVDGSTLELSADGPLREPFVAYSQGCSHWSHWAIVLEDMLQSPAFNKLDI